MTLRDWFAGQAMSALIDGYHRMACDMGAQPFFRTGFDDNPHGDTDASMADELALEAYIIASAMLAARTNTMQRSDAGVLAETTPATSTDDTRIENLGLSSLARNGLSRAGIRTVGELRSRTDRDLLMIRAFGRKSLKETRAKLADFDTRNPKGHEHGI